MSARIISALIFVALFGNTAFAATATSGQVQFTGTTSGTVPVRLAGFEILDTNGNVIGSGTTDSSGAFSATLSSSVSSIQIKITASYSGVLSVVNSSGTIFTMTSSATSPDNVNYTFTSDSTTAKAFEIFENLHTCYSWYTSNSTELTTSDTLNSTTVYYYPDTSVTAYYSGGTIHLGLGYAEDVTVLRHEFGHAIMASIGIIPMGGTHHLDGIYDSRLAWSEGFANYCVAAISNSPITIYGYSLNLNKTDYPLSIGSEMRIAAALWKLHNISSAAKILSALDLMEYPNYRDALDFYAKWQELGLTSGIVSKFEEEGIYLNAKGIYTANFDKDYVKGSKSYYWESGWSKHGSDPTPWGTNWRGDSSSNLANGYHSAPASLNYNNDTNYSYGSSNYGWAQSPAINLASINNPALVFKCNYETDSEGAGQRKIQIINVETRNTIASYNIATSGGSSEARECQKMGFWHSHVISLNPTWGNVLIRFYFTTAGSTDMNHKGWFVDDVSIQSSNSSIPAFSPTNLEQFKSTGQSLATNEINPDDKVKFKATVGNSYYSGATVKLQVEVKPANIPFDGTVTSETDFKAAGETAEINVTLTDTGDSKWRIRGVDSLGFASDWVSYGNNNDESDTDFIQKESSASKAASNAGSGDGGGGGGGGGCGGSINVNANSSMPLALLITILIACMIRMYSSRTASL
ncbi:MAG: hypothetical protein HY606_05185 [Planctomycetes bacterium]|nr:hypothetical protein [Planctomycetota bacterium]